jgi:hypothetical protein
MSRLRGEGREGSREREREEGGERDRDRERERGVETAFRSVCVCLYCLTSEA